MHVDRAYLLIQWLRGCGTPDHALRSGGAIGGFSTYPIAIIIYLYLSPLHDRLLLLRE